MMEKKIKKELTLTVVNLPVAILKHPKWLAVNYPPAMRENNLTNLLKESLSEILNLAKKEKLKQVKVATPPEWKKLKEVGFIRTVYYVTASAQKIAKIVSKNYQIVQIRNPKAVENLIHGQFIYHCQYKPSYFTCNVNDSVSWFLKIAKEGIQNNNGFLLAAQDKGKFVGFLYGEIEENEGCVDELFVDEKFRGKGFGKALLKAATEEFWKRRIKKIGLFVGVDEKALGFYEKFGFKKEFVNWINNLS